VAEATRLGWPLAEAIHNTSQGYIYYMLIIAALLMFCLTKTGISALELIGLVTEPELATQDRI